jgi:hypothetical protein
MSALVVVSVTNGSEGLAALGEAAGVGLVSRVLPLMHVQVSALDEGLAAPRELARIFYFPLGVDLFYVEIKSELSGIAFAAFGAMILLIL